MSRDAAIRPVDPTSPIARQALLAYLEDVAARYHGRPPTPAELTDAVAQHPTDGLVPPDGVFLVATTGPAVHGCVGLAQVEPGLGEIRRLHVAAGSRRTGLGRRLMLEVEDHARTLGLTALRLDTREDLVESQRLYLSLGYRECPPHSGGRYSDRWYAKSLRSEA
jgi:ribosomal protein S18 acetylase RimI-like enzyme